MPRTYAEVRTLALDILIDAGIDPGGSANQVFAEAELDAFIPGCVDELSDHWPRLVKDTTLTATASSWDITLSAEILRNLKGLLPFVEYDPESGSDPTDYRRNFEGLTRDVIRLKLDTAPAGGEALHLYLLKKHILVNVGTTDLAGAVKTLAAAGASSLALKLLGTGFIAEDTKLTIAGDSTVYAVTAKATIAASEATVSIYPVLAVEAAVDAVVTLAEPTSSLSTTEERILADMVAARAAINVSRKYIGAINVGSGRSGPEMLAWGQNKLADVYRQLRGIAQPTTFKEYPRG